MAVILRHEDPSQNIRELILILAETLKRASHRDALFYYPDKKQDRSFFIIEFSAAGIYSCQFGNAGREAMKFDIDKIIDTTIDKMQTGAEKLAKAMRRLLMILILLAAAIAGIFLIKHEPTRTYGVVIFILSFVWLYLYVVQRRGTRKR
jgi:hypothetical protein